MVRILDVTNDQTFPTDSLQLRRFIVRAATAFVFI